MRRVHSTVTSEGCHETESSDVGIIGWPGTRTNHKRWPDFERKGKSLPPHGTNRQHVSAMRDDIQYPSFWFRSYNLLHLLQILTGHLLQGPTITLTSRQEIIPQTTNQA